MNANRRSSGGKRNNSNERKRSNERKKVSSRKKSARRSSRKGKERPKFPVVDIHNLLCGEDPIEKVETEAALFLTASEAYVTHEILELASNHAISKGSNEITASDIIVAIQNDEELVSLFGHVIENELNEMKEKKEAKERKAKEAEERKAKQSKEKKQQRRKVKEKSPETDKTE